MNNLFTQEKLHLSVSSPEEIRTLSKGEVVNSHTLNHRTKHPEAGGLFCPGIFGTDSDYVCSCGRLQGFHNRNRSCSVCFSYPTAGYTKRSFFGHIELVSPVVHPWFNNSSQMSTLFGLENSSNLIYNCNKPGTITVSQQLGVISLKHINDLLLSIIGNEDYVNNVELTHSLLCNLNLCSEYLLLREKMIRKSKKESAFRDFVNSKINRYQLLESYVRNKKRPEWVILKTLPVLPPDLRPILVLKDNLLISSDLNTLYRVIINRNKRLSAISNRYHNGSMIVVEKRMIQNAVTQLFENEKTKFPIVNRKKEPLVSVSKRLGGKRGRFRANLLGKRVNYSARSVIIVNPKLKLGQCALPLTIALTLYRPFISCKIKQWLVQNRINSQDFKRSGIYVSLFYLIQNIIKDHPVMLNRAPTLHRMNIQGFEPILTTGSAIQLHPLVCSSFNADFDGDQMAVHLPLSLETKLETQTLMMPDQNILGPANGNPIITPSQEIVLGVFYATQLKKNANLKELPLFYSTENIKQLYLQEILSLQHPLRLIVNGQPITTTVGRVLFFRLFPRLTKLSFFDVNKPIEKSLLSSLVAFMYKNETRPNFNTFIGRLMSFGFYVAFKMGLSLTRKDLIPSTVKKKVILHSGKECFKNSMQEKIKQLLHDERKKKDVSVWNGCLSHLSDHLLPSTFDNDSLTEKPSIYLSLKSGAKGSPIQIRQLACMRGNMVRTTGETVQQPILSNLKEGLSTLEYFYSSHGSRKGVIDTSLKTAVAGYFTRKLFSSSQDHLIVEEDCKTSYGISIKSLIPDQQIGACLKDYFFQRIIGRVLSEDVLSPREGTMLLRRDQIILEPEIDLLKGHRVEEICVRSVLTCQSVHGSCQKCYGATLHSKSFPHIGEPVGVVAAQSIGEPGTQLTMRTFHIGGALQSSSNETFIRSPIFGRVLYARKSFALNSKGEKISLSPDSSLIIFDVWSTTQYRYPLPLGCSLLVEDGDLVHSNQVLARWNSSKKLIPCVRDGAVHLLKKNKLTSREDVSYIGYILTKEYLPVQRFEVYKKDLLTVSNGQQIQSGDCILLRPNDYSQSKDITNDLALVSQILEVVQKAKDESLTCPLGGRIFLYSNKKQLPKSTYISLCDKNQKLIFKKKVKNRTSSLPFSQFDYIKHGGYLDLKAANPFELVKWEGIAYAISYLTPKIYFLYLGQGAKVNDRHIEIVLNQMLQRIIVQNMESAGFFSPQRFSLPRYILTKKEFYTQYLSSLSRGSILGTGNPLIYGLSSVASQQESFLAAASFQKTSKVLSEAALLNKDDDFTTVMASTSIGRLIPVGTGLQ